MSEYDNLLDNITYLVGDKHQLTDSYSVPAFPVFSSTVVGFLSDLSKELLSHKNIRSHVDVMSYAYWIRKASLEKEKALYDLDHRIGRGVAFHIAPSNVPVNFAVSMTSSLLAGNITIIRVSNKQFEEVDIICGAINRLLDCEAYADMKRRLCIVRYDHSDEITEYLSSICDVRIIWGGDRTIREIRRFPIPSRAIEMCFADRHSVAVIDPDAYMKMDLAEVANKFYTDTYYSDQNACSSPRIVVWTKGSPEAKRRFWSALRDKVDREYDMNPIQAVDKQSIFSELAMKTGAISLYPIAEDKHSYNKLFVVDVDSLSVSDHETVMDYKMGGGYFYQITITSLNDLVPILDKKCQTVAVLGIDKNDIVRFLMEKGVRGIDRVVNIGDTMGLEFVWDGYNMIETMSREVYIYAG
ncbi:Acyl-CoA reductase (LuxC) [Ruminococcaceae bacterium KH2T8]|nr:Acyl-CoA reductase (LuxC) [Ruminococcaceae bacterium KH2T8]